MNSHYNTDYDYFINIDTENYIERYDDQNNAIYYKRDAYIVPYLMYNKPQLAVDTPYKNIDYSTAMLITHIVGGFVVCIVTIFILM
jgi:hypothetical protein